MDSEQAGAHEVYGSRDRMLSAAALSEVLGSPVAQVRREPFATAGHSSTEAAFEAVYLDGATSPSLVAKTVTRSRDWVAIATHDTVDREVRAWEAGLLDRLHGPAAHAVRAGARDDATYSILMPDLSPHLLPDEHIASPSPVQQQLVVEALAALHAEFWMDDALGDGRLGLSSLALQVSHTSPSALERVRQQMGASPIVEWIARGWEQLPDLVDSRVAHDIRTLADDPAPLAAAAARFPQTLVHTDPRPANLAVDTAGGTVYFLDWARPAPTLPGYDLLYWVFTGDRHLAVPRDELIADYARALRRALGNQVSWDWWEGQLALSYLAFVASFAGIMAKAMPSALAWWIERAQPALRALG